MNVLACENALFASDILKKAILDSQVPITLDELKQIACFPNTAVDRMVFEVEINGGKAVEIGNDYELVIEKSKLTNPLKEPIKGAIYTTNLQKYLERKLYITNCAHAIAAYLGYLEGYEFVQEAFADKKIYENVVAAVNESAEMLSVKYGFSWEDLQAYITFVLGRFMTDGVQDPISRVARSPIRKLHPNDRLVGPALACEEFNINNQALCKGIAAAFLFDYPNDKQAIELQHYIATEGMEQALVYYTNIDPSSNLFTSILAMCDELQSIKNK
nr:hypothetical protein [Bacillus sp. FJAT-50079]